MSKFLLDTNIWIYYLKGEFDLDKKFSEIGIENIGVSEISIAELKFGAYNSQKVKANLEVINTLITQTSIYPIYPCLDFYGKEKSRLKNIGRIIDEFDLLIGSTSVINDLILVTRNTKHFKNISDIKIENWIE